MKTTLPAKRRASAKKKPDLKDLLPHQADWRTSDEDENGASPEDRSAVQELHHQSGWPAKATPDLHILDSAAWEAMQALAAAGFTTQSGHPFSQEVRKRWLGETEPGRSLVFGRSLW